MSTTQSQEFIVNGSFIVPAGVSGIWVTLVAGGAAGAGTAVSGPGGGGGGAGEYCRKRPLCVAPGQVIPVTLGAGGVGVLGNHKGASGGDSAFGPIVVRGGWGGVMTNLVNTNGCFSGAGGNGGGIGGWRLLGVSCASTGANTGGPGLIGFRENRWYFGGSGGGGGAAGGAGGFVGGRGGPCESWLGGVGGTGDPGFFGGGGGGAASIMGTGGAGGQTSATVALRNGQDAPATSYGAGGGGALGVFSGPTERLGGSGASGYCLVEWIA